MCILLVLVGRQGVGFYPSPGPLDVLQASISEVSQESVGVSCPPTPRFCNYSLYRLHPNTQESASSEDGAEGQADGPDTTHRGTARERARKEEPHEKNGGGGGGGPQRGSAIHIQSHIHHIIDHYMREIHAFVWYVHIQ